MLVEKSSGFKREFGFEDKIIKNIYHKLVEIVRGNTFLTIH
jgi:hypothetical protein